MGFLGGILLIAAIGGGLLLAGYGIAARLTRAEATERLAAAELGGLAVVLLLLSVINALQPLRDLWAWVCLGPCLFPLAMPAVRNKLLNDLRALGGEGRWRVAIGTLASMIFLGACLEPYWFHPSLVYFDGTSNHDSFFWITGADYLQQHNYLSPPSPHDGTQISPGLVAFTGFLPVWGRMGGEGYIALIASLVRFEPVYIYAYASAALFLPWLAAVYLVVKTFVADRLNVLAAAAFGLLQAIFLFFHGNANLPNLIGLLSGTLLLVAIARTMALTNAPRTAIGWLALGALSLHAVLCSYPEILPFVLLPSALFWVCAWQRRPHPGFRGTPIAIAVGLAINWVSTVRAGSGFWHSLITAHANTQWQDMFRRLDTSEIIPSLATLNVYAGHWIGPWPAGFLSILFLAVGYVVLQRIRHPVGIVMAFSGPGMLLLYTIATGFHYGMQKTVQFGGTVIAAIFPVAAALVLTQIATATSTSRLRRTIAIGSLAIIGGFFVFAICLGLSRARNFATTKSIHQDNLGLRNSHLPELHGPPVLVAANTFTGDFFHGMWAHYFMPRANLIFSLQEQHPGGYLERRVEIRRPDDPVEPTAFYVSRAWADTMDANAPRLLMGENFALVSRTNYMLKRHGLKPATGVPRQAAAIVGLTIHPFQDSRLQLTLRPDAIEDTIGRLAITRQAGNATWQHEFTGAAPWHLSVPLVSGMDNTISLQISAPSASSESYPYILTDLNIMAVQDSSQSLD